MFVAVIKNLTQVVNLSFTNSFLTALNMEKFELFYLKIKKSK